MAGERDESMREREGKKRRVGYRKAAELWNAEEKEMGGERVKD